MKIRIFIGLIVLMMTISNCNTSKKETKITNDFPLDMKLPMVEPPPLLIDDTVQYPKLNLYLGYNEKQQVAFNFNGEKNITFSELEERFMSFKEKLNGRDLYLKVALYVDSELPFMYVNYIKGKLKVLSQYNIEFFCANGTFLRVKIPPLPTCDPPFVWCQNDDKEYIKEPLYLNEQIDILDTSLVPNWNPIICKCSKPIILKHENTSQIHRTATGEIVYNDTLTIAENELESFFINILKEHETLKSHMFLYKVSPKTSYRNYLYDLVTLKKAYYKMWSEITQEINQTDYHNTPRSIARTVGMEIPYVLSEELAGKDSFFKLK